VYFCQDDRRRKEGTVKDDTIGGWYVIQVDHNNRRFDWYLDYVLDFQMLGVG
jgi:hypothetical protein